MDVKQAKKCGIYPVNKFKNKLPWLDILRHAQNLGIELVEILEDNLEDELNKGEIQLIVGKFAYDFGAGNHTTLSKFREAEKKVKILDSLDSQAMLFNRREIAAVLSTSSLPVEVLVPRHVVVQRPHEEYQLLLSQAKISYPLIIKSEVACGTSESHYMSIVFNEEQIHANPPPFPAIFQEYYNHNATIYKVYCVGRAVHVDRRYSIRNFSADDTNEAILFDSQRMSEIIQKDGDLDSIFPPHHIIEGIRIAISNSIGLSIFGFDLIRDVKSGNYFLIDVNFFPGFIGMENFAEQFVNHIHSSFP